MPPAPQISFLFARGEDATHDNQWLCAFNLSTSPRLGFSNGSNTFQNLAGSNPVALRNFYQVIYIAPGLSAADYAYLQQMVAPGGFIEQFVSLGGVAVINVAGTLGDQANIAPGGVGFSNASQHDAEDILAPDHAYVTGLGFGGQMLGVDDFSNWGPTDTGTLTNLPADATIVLANSGQPTWAEYQYESGRVIVTTLRYCWDPAPDPAQSRDPILFLSPSQWAAAANLLRYGRFFSGSAMTPAPTVTATGSPTPTRTRKPSATPTATLVQATPTPTPPATPTVTPLPTPSVAFVDVIGAIFEEIDVSGTDVNGDGAVTAADVPALIKLSQ